MNQQVYLQLAKRGNWASGSNRDLKIVSATTGPPTSRKPDTIVVKLILDIPREAFNPLTVAAVSVPLSDIERPTAVVEDANA